MKTPPLRIEEAPGLSFLDSRTHSRVHPPLKFSESKKTLMQRAHNDI